MTMLRVLVILARSMVILTIGMTGAAVVDSLLSGNWQVKIDQVLALTDDGK